ncbi:uncharacterized protein LOC127264007 [Andrographis paniculata]|uniref:uncharacterized protein LOC127264007 n=1 Tax=Andrographis paniculata TaxID=175694 RepID=UPI0021E6F261|nr:uncharacterized protein LOC127264007 [Andrographis paniculata]
MATAPKRHTALDQDVRELVYALSNRCRIIKSGGNSSTVDYNQVRGVQIITLEGNNMGASMREGESAVNQMGEEFVMTTSINSNFQAVNNSIMLAGSYNSHIAIMPACICTLRI